MHLTASDTLKSVYDYRLSEAEFAAVGRIIIEFASIERNADITLDLYGKETPRHLSDRVREVGKVIRAVGDDHAQLLSAEFTWAMKETAEARNLLAHGLLLYPEDGPVELWSEKLDRHLTLPQVLMCLPYAHYANYCLQYLIWHRLDIKPPKPFPDRPAFSKAE